MSARGPIITDNVYPPIPDRNFDWRALHRGEDEEPNRHGWGRTEAEAIADLARLDAEEADYLDEMDLIAAAEDGNEHARAELAEREA